jgi:hypothetical protein
VGGNAEVTGRKIVVPGTAENSKRALRAKRAGVPVSLSYESGEWTIEPRTPEEWAEWGRWDDSGADRRDGPTPFGSVEDGLCAAGRYAFFGGRWANDLCVDEGNHVIGTELGAGVRLCDWHFAEVNAAGLVSQPFMDPAEWKRKTSPPTPQDPGPTRG